MASNSGWSYVQLWSLEGPMTPLLKTWCLKICLATTSRVKIPCLYRFQLLFAQVFWTLNQCHQADWCNSVPWTTLTLGVWLPPVSALVSALGGSLPHLTTSYHILPPTSTIHLSKNLHTNSGTWVHTTSFTLRTCQASDALQPGCEIWSLPVRAS